MKVVQVRLIGNSKAELESAIEALVSRGSGERLSFGPIRRGRNNEFLVYGNLIIEEPPTIA